MNEVPVAGGARRHPDLVAGLAVALAAVVAYATSLAGTFVFDDIHSVASNPALRSLGNLGRFFVDPALFSSNGSTGNVMYRPVLLASFALDHATGGGAALQFKLTSLWLHAATAALLFSLLAAHGSRRGAALFAALLFAVHPMASETVNLVSARSEALCLFGLLLGLRCHLWLPARPRLGAYGLLAATVIACGSKETGVVLPALLCAQEWSCRGLPRTRAAALGLGRRLWPACAVVVVYLVVRKLLLGQATAPLLGRDGGDPMYGHTRDLATQLATMGAALPGALLRLLWPSQQTLDPQVVYHRTLSAWPALAGWLGLAACTALGVRQAQRRPLVALGTALAWATALPWVLFPLNLPLAEHRLYGPLAGLLMVLAGALDRAPVAFLPRLLRARWLPALPLVACALLAGRRSLDYRDESVLWQGALRQYPLSFRAHWGLGATAMVRGDLAAAEPWLARACALYPGFRAARRTWIECMLALPEDQGFAYRALVAAEALTAQKGDDPDHRMLHANALQRVGIARSSRSDIEAAEAMALSCLQIAPPKAMVYRLAADCRRRLGDWPAALRHLDAAIACGLDFPAVRAERSEVLRALGRLREADQDLRAAWQQAPMDSAVRAAWARQQSAAPR